MSKIIDKYIEEEMGGVVLMPEYWLRTLLCYLTANEKNGSKLQSIDPIGGYKGTSDDEFYDSTEMWSVIEVGCVFEKGTIIFKVDDDDLPVSNHDSYTPHQEEFEAWLAVHDSDFMFDEQSTRELELFVLDPEMNAFNLAAAITTKGREHGLFRLHVSQGKLMLWITCRMVEGFDSGKPMLLDKLRLKAKENKLSRIEHIANILHEEFAVPDYTSIKIEGARSYALVTILI